MGTLQRHNPRPSRFVFRSQTILLLAVFLAGILIMFIFGKSEPSPSQSASTIHRNRPLSSCKIEYTLTDKSERPGSNFVRYAAYEICDGSNKNTLSIYRWAELLRDSPQLASEFSHLLAQAPYPAFFFETKGVSQNTVHEKQFEFILIQAPMLQRFAESNPDPDTFAPYFQSCESASCCAFDNLGRDARLIAPKPLVALPITVYSHLAAFVRGAPHSQQIALWSTVCQEYLHRIGQPDPVWLSTEGSGVAWLHIRLDSRPKYYKTTEFAQEQ